MMISIAQWLKQCTLPKLEARMLLQACTGYSRSQLITCDQTTLSDLQLQQLKHWQHRREAGEPMAYILGQREFYGRMFTVSPAVLIPRPETEHLLEAALEKLPENGRIWDLGTGSGAVAITIQLERPDVRVYASDVSAAALEIAQCNATQLQAKISFRLGSWFEARSEEMSDFDVLVSNPPYIEANDPHLQQNGLPYEPSLALTDFADGLSCIRELAAGAKQVLKCGGWLILEHGYNQGEAVRQILHHHQFSLIQTLPDLAGLDRITLGQYN